jgi:Flp pilus assembly protein TadG
MEPSWHDVLSRRHYRSRQSGQALLEFACVALIMIGLAFGLIDVSRAIHEKQVLINLSREGSNLAFRLTSLSDTAQAVVDGASPLDMNKQGRVIVTEVHNDGTNCQVADQVSLGGLKGQTSRIGKKGGKPFPCMSADVPRPNQSAFVTEVFYDYEPVTPVGKMMQVAIPSTLYDVAYF